MFNIYLWLLRSLSLLEIKENFLNLPKVAYQKSTANIILNGKIIELISTKKQNKTSMCVFNTTVQQRIEFPAIVVREKKRERERERSKQCSDF